MVDNGTTPTAIEKLVIRGLEFTGGGGVPDTGEPVILLPSNGSTINLGANSGSGVSKIITIKGKNLTGDLTVAVSTGLRISYGQAMDASSVTIPMAQALLGAQVTVSYSGSGALANGSMVISHGGSVLASAVVVADAAPVSLAAVKLTGTQWMQTDYVPGPNTEFSMKCKFTENANTNQSGYSYKYCYFLCCPYDGNKRFSFYNGAAGQNPSSIFGQIEDNSTTPQVFVGSEDITMDNSYLNLVKGGSGCTLTFLAGGSTSYNLSLPIKSTSMSQPMAIGYLFSQQAIYGVYDLTIYEFIISENGVEKRHYVPQSRNGVPGLYDTVTGAFISSETATEFVAIPLT